MTLSELDDSIYGEPDIATGFNVAAVHCECYYAVGRKTAEIDASGRTTRFGYDGLGRLIVVVLPNPATGASRPWTTAAARTPARSPPATPTTRSATRSARSMPKAEKRAGNSTRWVAKPRVRIPRHAGHPFQRMPVTDSTRLRSPACAQHPHPGSRQRDDLDPAGSELRVRTATGALAHPERRPAAKLAPVSLLQIERIE